MAHFVEREVPEHMTQMLSAASDGERNQAHRGFESLTPSHWRILEHIRRGRTNAQIAAALHMSRETVKQHISEILRRTGTADRTQLIDQALTVGFFSKSGPACATTALLSRGLKVSSREREILALLATGANDAMIGAELSVAHRTVRAHITSLFAKLDLGNRTELALFGMLAHLRDCDSCRTVLWPEAYGDG